MATPRRPVRLTRALVEEGTAYLRERDRRLGRWIDRLGGSVPLRRQPHPFGALCRSILSQQLGAAAARTIHARFLDRFAPEPRPDPARLLEIPEPELRSCGISARKVTYLRALAREFHEGSLRRARFAAMTDEEIVERLTRLPGIGPWTAEMFLIFALGRPDVFSVGDLALRQGVCRVVGRELTPPEILRVTARWSPWRSVASLYLWRIAHHQEKG